MIKTELHAHTADDPEDRVPHTARELIDHAAALRYGALAITLHDVQLDPDPHVVYAAERGIVLLRGVERTIEGAHILIVNAPATATRAVGTFTDLAGLRADHPHVLVVVPHPFYPLGSALGRRRLDEHAALFDAIEYNAMYAPGLNFNARAEAWARASGKPLVGNGDVHRLRQLGTTWSLVDAPPDADAICDAIRAGRVELRTTALSWPRAVGLYAAMVLGGILGHAADRAGRLRSSGR